MYENTLNMNIEVRTPYLEKYWFLYNFIYDDDDDDDTKNEKS